jgi:hypothetical protein
MKEVAPVARNRECPAPFGVAVPGSPDLTHEIAQSTTSQASEGTGRDLWRGVLADYELVEAP